MPIFDPSMPMADIQQKIAEIQTKQQCAQFVVFVE
jgi:hypothetical protein